MLNESPPRFTIIVAKTLKFTMLYLPSSWRKTVNIFPITIAGTPESRPNKYFLTIGNNSPFAPRISVN